MNCLIVDDHAITRLTVIHLLQIESPLKPVAECEHTGGAYRNIAVEKIDLLLLDIQVPGISGIKLLKGLGETSPLIKINSEKKDCAAEAFDLNVIDFIAKPITPGSFLKAANKAKETYNSDNTVEGNTLIMNKNFLPVSDVYKTSLNK